MPAGEQAIPATPFKTLLEWIDDDDGDPSNTGMPACTDQVSTLHAQICSAPSDAREPLLAPPGLHLAPLG